MARTSSALKLLLASAAFAAPAQAETTYTNDSGGTATFGGQLDPSFISVDDGKDTNGEFTDNAASNTRINFSVKQDVGSGSSVRFFFETALGFRQSDGISQLDTPGGFEWDRTRLRHVDLQFETATAGKFYFGQGSMSGDGIGQIDYAGTGLTNYSASSPDLSGSYLFRTTDGDLSDIAVADVLSDFDAGRRGRVRYDTPEFLNGFTLSVSYGKEILSEDTDQEDWYTGAHLAYERVFGNGTRLGAGIGYQRRERKPDEGDDVTRDDLFASASVLFESGVNFSAAVGHRDTEGVDFDARYYYVKAGYTTEIFKGIGDTAFAVDYFSGSDYAVEDDDSSAVGVGVVQSIDGLNAEVYLGYRRNSYDQPGTDFEDMDVYVIGTRVRF